MVNIHKYWMLLKLASIATLHTSFHMWIIEYESCFFFFYGWGLVSTIIDLSFGLSNWTFPCCFLENPSLLLQLLTVESLHLHPRPSYLLIHEWIDLKRKAWPMHWRRQLWKASDKKRRMGWLSPWASPCECPLDVGIARPPCGGC